MTRSVLLAFLCLGASISRAEETLPGGATITFDKLLIHENNNPTAQEPAVDPDSTQNYFNLAHCVCSQAQLANPNPEFHEGTYRYLLTVQGFTTPVDRPLEIWTGADCGPNIDSTQRDENCTNITTTENVSVINAMNGTEVAIPIYDLMLPRVSERMGCLERRLDGTTWVIADGDGDGTIDYGTSAKIETDTEAPPLPTNFSAVGAENAIKIAWTPPSDTTDIFYYQVMCAKAVSLAPGKSNPPAPRYKTARQLCSTPSDPMMGQTEISTNSPVDAGTGGVTLPDEWTQIPPAYLCGETSTSTATGIRVDGLENGVPYVVALLVMDKFGNARGTTFQTTLVPTPAIDFWEDLHDQGSGVEGGFCLVAQAYGDNNPLTQTLRSFRDHTLADSAFGRWLVDVYYGTVGALDLHGSLALRIVVGLVLLPFVAIALLWHALTLPGMFLLVAFMYLARKRIVRMRGLATAATVLAVLVLVPARADAQVPYWEENDFTDPAAELPPGHPDRVHWHAGVRVGPYVPGIDAQLNMPVGKYDGPYEQMFGGYSIMPILDVERFLWRGVGQAGVGFSIGYMGKKARAWVANSDPMDPNRPRAEGDDNKFRLIPMALSAVYRFSYLDDHYGIPLVPYARAGLGYYVWWITAPNGDFAKACKDGGNADGCARTTAAGASLGFVGSIGLAIRAERIDGSAARSMQESGLEHAGFYAEYSLGKVDGFGSEKKLSVGDATWFAGVDFEF